MSLVYKKNSYYIDASELPFDDSNNRQYSLLLYPFKNPIDYLLYHVSHDSGNGWISNYMRNETDHEIGKLHFTLLHELNHYYQDLSFSACLCEKMILSHFEKYAIQHFKLGDCQFPIFDIINKPKFEHADNFLEMRIHPNEPQGWYSSQDLTVIKKYQYLYNRIFNTNYLSDFHFTLTYQDLLESYAELKAGFDLNYEVTNEDTAQYVHSLYKKLNNLPQYHIKEDGLLYLDYDTIDNKYSRKYNIIRYIPMLLANIGNRNTFGIKDNIVPLLKFFEDYYPTCPKHELSETMEYTRMIEFFLLLAIDISMCIPAPNYILDNIISKEYENREEYESEMNKYTPPIKFYQILDMYDKYADYFMNKEFSNKTYQEVYDYIANKCGWCTYDDVVRSYTIEYESNTHIVDVMDNYQYKILIGKGMSKVNIVAAPNIKHLIAMNVPINIVFLRGKCLCTDDIYIRPAYCISSFLYSQNNGAYEELIHKEYVEDVISSVMALRLHENIYTKEYVVQPFGQLSKEDNIIYSVIEQLCRKDFVNFLLTKRIQKQYACPLMYMCRQSKDDCCHIPNIEYFKICATDEQSLLNRFVKAIYKYQD